MKKICVATGTRAEYGLLKPLIDKILLEPQWQLKLLVTGAHLSPEFGLTYQQIENDGLKIDIKVEMLLSSDTPEGITKSMGLGMIGYADALKVLKPDLLIVLGDRYEMLALVSTALIFKIPIAHISGGETTEGAYDDAIRHSITKMSHLHFASTELHKKRIIQLGENPKYTYNVGAIGLDNVFSMNLLTKTELEKELQIQFKKYNYLISFHPETLSLQSTETEFKTLLNAIDKQEDSFFIFTHANADTNGRIINQMMSEFVGKHPQSSVLVSSLGSLRYLSVMKVVDAIIGNSSSGIVEAPSLRTATVNLGDRQKGRIQAASVLNSRVNENDILACIDEIKTQEFKDRLSHLKNPYGCGDTSRQIIEILKNINFKSFHTKKFYDAE